MLLLVGVKFLSLVVHAIDYHYIEVPTLSLSHLSFSLSLCVCMYVCVCVCFFCSCSPRTEISGQRHTDGRLGHHLLHHQLVCCQSLRGIEDERGPGGGGSICTKILSFLLGQNAPIILPMRAGAGGRCCSSRCFSWAPASASSSTPCPPARSSFSSLCCLCRCVLRHSLPLLHTLAISMALLSLFVNCPSLFVCLDRLYLCLRLSVCLKHTHTHTHTPVSPTLTRRCCPTFPSSSWRKPPRAWPCEGN